MRPYDPIGLLGRESVKRRVTVSAEIVGRRRGPSRLGRVRRPSLGSDRRLGRITSGLTKVLQTGTAMDSVVANARRAVSIGPVLFMAIGVSATAFVYVPTTMDGKA